MFLSGWLELLTHRVAERIDYHSMSSSNHGIYNERLKLATLEEDDFIRIGLMAVIGGMVYLLYHFLGNTPNFNVYGRSIFAWVTDQWNSGSGASDYSHGWLIPIVSLAIVYWKRREIVEAPKNINKFGLVLIALALFAHWAGTKAQHPRISLFALILFLWAVPLYLCGWRTAKHLIFPCTFLFFCVPLQFLEELSKPLQRLVSIVGADMLDGLGIPVDRVGTVVTARNGDFTLNVEAPCSGLRSLIAMMALTAVYSYITMPSFFKKWSLFLCAIPLAVVGNIFRVMSIGLVSSAFGQKIGAGLFHDYSGYLVFAVAISLMVAIGGLLDLQWKENWEKWKSSQLRAG